MSITVYGRDDNRSDQIYGSEFIYDPASGDVTANGEVHIDLAADSSVAAGGSLGPASQSGNFVHVNTSELTFNRKSGVAQTKQKIEFRFPGANGSAVGANYDSHLGALTLDSTVKIRTTEKQKATITGQSATITRDPREIVLHAANVEQTQRTVSADQVKVLLRDDSTIERVVGSGHLHAVQRGEKAFEISASQGALLLAGSNQPRSARISGGVDFASHDKTPARGSAQAILLRFGPKGEVTNVQAQGSVNFSQGPAGRSEELQAAVVDLFIRNGKRLQKAVTSGGPARIVANQQATRSTITAGKFEAYFDAQNRMRSVVGSPGATIVSSTPGQPERTAAAHELIANFSGTNEITFADLAGDFHYQEGQRSATAAHAHYNVEEGTYFLTGSPRVVESGASLSADSLLLNRKTGTVYG
ncbi:MAG: LptA/OstA family protein, partial [Candidatus Angelobacter sp.]